MGVHKNLIYARQITMGCHYLMLFTIELFDFLFMAMINNSILTSATRSASCDRGAPNPQGRSSGERSRNNEEVVQATQASALGRDGVHEHVTNIRMTDKTETVIQPLNLRTFPVIF